MIASLCYDPFCFTIDNIGDLPVASIWWAYCRERRDGELIPVAELAESISLDGPALDIQSILAETEKHMQAAEALLKDGKAFREGKRSWF